ncbi:MAG: prepilin peptidase [Bacteroidetes bacterium]|nr:prepilin peptidase [Bacteroidota bacterium]
MTADWTVLPALFVAGTIIGSFISALTYRLPRNISMWHGRSSCTHCRQPIPWFYNIPVWGYAVQKGRCSSCGHPISIRYLVLEVVCGLMLIAGFLHFGFTMAWVKYSFLGYLLLAMSIVDHDYKIIPNKLNLTGLILGLTFALVQGEQAFSDAFVGGLAGAFSFLMIRVVGTAAFKKEAMGLGDVKLAGVLGVFLGVQLLIAGVFFAFLLLTVVGWARALKDRRVGHREIPLAPYLCAGTVAALIAGHPFIEWYLQQFHVHG